MGLTRRRALLAVALLLIAGTGCSDDGDASDAGPSSTDTTTTTTTPETSSTTADGDLDIGGGSRYLALNVRDDRGANQIVLRDLAEGTEEVVVSHPDRTYQGVDVTAEGAVTWSEATADAGGSVLVRPSGGGPPVQVQDARAGCPRWLADGRLLVLLDEGEDSTPAIVDPATGAIDDVLAIEVGTASCVAPAGPDHVVFPRPISEPYGPEGSQVVRSRLDGAGEEVVGQVPGGCWPLDVTVDVQGEQLAAGVVCEDARLTGLYIGTVGAADLRQAFGENDDPDPERAFVATHPAWSGDGTFVAFDRGDQRGERPVISLWTVTPAGDAAELDPRGALAAFSPPVGGGRDGGRD